MDSNRFGDSHKEQNTKKGEFLKNLRFSAFPSKKEAFFGLSSLIPRLESDPAINQTLIPKVSWITVIAFSILNGLRRKLFTPLAIASRT